MLVDFNRAEEAFARLPSEQKSPYFHPIFVVSDALRDPSLTPLFFVYKDGGEIFYHAFHLGKVAGTPFFDIQSPYAYGGPLSSTTEPSFLAQAGRHYLAWCRENKILAEFIRFHPLLKNWRFYYGERLSMRETVWIDLLWQDRFSLYSTRVRTAIRKAVKNGLRIRWEATWDSRRDELCKIFFGLYSQAMTELKADEFYFFPRDYFQNLMNWSHSYLALCLRGDELLAAALFLKESNLLEYHLAACHPEGKKLCASNLILDEAVMEAQKLGCRILHLGGGTDNSPDNPLLFYKSGFSPKRASFLIGKTIHAPKEYEEMQKDWQKKYGIPSEKTLFYRFPPNQ